MKRTTLFTTLAIVIAAWFCAHAVAESPAAKPKAKGKPTELVFGNKATLSGKLEQIKTNGEDGNAVFPFYLTTDNGIIVKAAVDFDPGDTGEKLEGMEVQLIEGDDSALEPFNGKRVTISGRVSTGTDLHCHAFGLFIDSIKNIESIKDIEENPAGAGKAKPALSTDPLTIQLKESVTLEGKLFAQKFDTSAEDRKFKGETAFLPVIVMERKLAFKFSGLDKGFLHGEPPAEPVDRIELAFEDPSLLAVHTKSEGKSARIQGTLVIDQDNRLLPVKFEVSKLEILESAGKAKPASPEAGTQPRKEIVEFWKVAAPQWKAGPIIKLDEEEVDGTVQTHTSPGLAMITKVMEVGEMGYSITHKLINTTDKVLLAVHEVSWSNDPIKKLTETLYEFDSTPAKKHFREQKMKEHFFKMKSKPQSVDGSYATEKLDEKGVSTLKEERADWWEGGLK